MQASHWKKLNELPKVTSLEPGFAPSLLLFTNSVPSFSFLPHTSWAGLGATCYPTSVSPAASFLGTVVLSLNLIPCPLWLMVQAPLLQTQRASGDPSDPILQPSSGAGSVCVVVHFFPSFLSPCLFFSWPYCASGTVLYIGHMWKLTDMVPALASPQSSRRQAHDRALSVWRQCCD